MFFCVGAGRGRAESGHDSYTVKFTISSVQFNDVCIFEELCNSHHSLVEDISITPEEIPHFSAATLFSSHLPQALDNHSSTLFILMCTYSGSFR